MLSIIVVIGKNRVIGCNNKLLWDIPEDLARFKKITTGHPVIMGKATFESIGKALPNRTNIILTLDKNFRAEGCQIANSIDEGIELAKKSPGGEESFVIGGGQIYKQMIDLADKLYLTVVDDSPEADTYFPEYTKFKNIVKEETIETDNLKYSFLELIK